MNKLHVMLQGVEQHTHDALRILTHETTYHPGSCDDVTGDLHHISRITSHSTQRAALQDLIHVVGMFNS